MSANIESGRFATMNSAEASNIETLKTDTVVIGAGGGGLAAAVAAAEKGSKVIILEKLGSPGGNSAMAWGLFAAESALQKRLRIDDTRDKLFKVAMEYAHWRINARLVRAFIDKSADTIQWLEDKGITFNYIPPLYSSQPFRTWHCPSVEKRGGKEIIQALVKSCEGMGVQLFNRAPVKKIMTGQNGDVTGIKAEVDGKELEIIAGSVIIATGGFGGNKELLKKYFRYYTDDINCGGLPLMGDGLLMAMEIGAATEGMGVLLSGGPKFPDSRIVDNFVQEPNTVWVNRNGERFVDEKKGPSYYTQSANALDRQPGGISYTLFDEVLKKQAMEEGLVEGLSLNNSALSKLPELGKELQLLTEKGRVKISDTWDEIAAWMGAVPNVLKATIDEYNSYCDKGHDELFVKDRRYLQALRTPPYYAVKCSQSFQDTFGGIKINHHMEVLNQEDKPIPGLYGVGVCTGGWEGDTYDFMLAGSAFGFAVNSGRIAGENSAGYVSVK